MGVSYIGDLNVGALHAASLVCSKDAARPALQQVRVLDERTFVGTDSYRLMLAFDGVMCAGDLIAHVRQTELVAAGHTLVSAALVDRFVKRVKSDKCQNIGARFDVVDGATNLIAGRGVESGLAAQVGLACERETPYPVEFPKIGAILKLAEPQPLVASFSAAFLADLSKVSVAAGGAKDTAWTLVGSTGDSANRSPTVWAAWPREVTLVMVLMPVRVEARSWVAPPVVVAA